MLKITVQAKTETVRTSKADFRKTSHLILSQTPEQSYTSDQKQYLTSYHWGESNNLFLPNLRFKPVKNGKNQNVGMIG